MSKSSQGSNDYTVQVLAELRDEKQAEKRMKEHAAMEWDKEFDAESKATRQKHGYIEARFVSCNDDLRELEKRLSKTDELVTAKAPNAEDDEASSSWSAYHIVLFWVAITGGVLAAVLGASNLYSNMMATMLPVFLEAPFLAWSLSTLLPLGSLSLEFASSRFSTNKGRQRYELTIFLSTAIALAAWAYLFSQTYPGVTAPLNINSLLSGSQGGSSLVLCQLIVELLAGSSLWIAANGIYRENHPDTLVDNPEYDALFETVKAQRALVKALSEEYGAVQGELARLEAERDLYIENRCIKLLALRNHKQAERIQFDQ